MSSFPLIIEPGPSPSALELVILAQRFRLSDDLSDRFGFDDHRLDEPMLRIIVALALRRDADRRGWMTSEELGLVALEGASGPATAKRLEVALRDTRHADTGPRLIEFQTIQTGGTGHRGGRSRGPYRLGIPAEQLNLDRAACLGFLAGRPMTAQPIVAVDLAEQFVAVDDAMSAGRLMAARTAAQAALQMIVEGRAAELRDASDHERCFQLARTFDRLANIDMELGCTRDGLNAAHRSRRLYERVRHPEGVAHTLQIEALLRGQSDDPADLRLSYCAARNALLRLDDATRGARKGARRAMYIGVLGQRLTHLGRTREAARRLEAAYHLCEAHDVPRWMAIWALRLAQNAVAARQLAKAENFMTTANELADRLSLPGEAALTRANAELHLAAGRPDEAERWIHRAARIGQSQGMLHQERLVQRLAERLQALRR